MLWLCLHFPQLPLEIFSRADVNASPWVITHGKGTRQTLLQCNTVAASLGLRPGMSLGAAYALTSTLQVRTRDEAAELHALEALAAWAGQFTSLVSLSPPHALLLEIEGSLRLFGGIDALLRRVQRRARHLGYLTEFGVAPTPLSAELLARAHLTTPVLHIHALPGTLRDIPLFALGLDEKLAQTLNNIGARCLGDVLRLPRADVSRRFGPSLIYYLDRLMGHRADPRAPYTPPACFEQRLALPVETINSEALLFPARRLLMELAGFLSARHAATQQLHWTLSHHRQTPTQLTLGLAAPNRDPHHLLTLLRETLARTTLAHPVEDIALRVTDIRPLQPRALSLDGTPETPDESWPLLVERLRARLGEDAVQGLQCRPDHRPEQAWRPCQPGATGPSLPYATRPLWLLPEPVALNTRDGAPYLDTPLNMEAGPERLESGWWDGGDIARDYFVATDAAHARYWVYRERHGGRQWFLHGYFA